LEPTQATSWKARFPSILNLLAFQATDQGPVGWVVAINKLADSEAGKSGGGQTPATSPAVVPFRRSDAALLTPFVALLEMHSRGAHRYQDLKELLVGLTRSLTTALDAKDSYTFGHSERVGRIAVELGREMGLGGEELGDIYLAGLLHDVGKIGIRDTVLLKPDTLTAEEREHIKQHVTIGYSILSDLRQIRNLLPGVLYHHERYDGTGYPDGLVGEKIPLLARILAVADAYDAMSTARPYRDAIPCRKVEEILRSGIGTQWDQQVIEAFLRCRQKIHTIRQRGVGDSLRLAIEGTLRSDSRPLQQLVELQTNRP
jgi:HD-GYP domain-containing protein (c-di-GMP phosphodiesterase class II)